METLFCHFISAPAETSARSFDGTAPFTVKVEPGRDRNVADTGAVVAFVVGPGETAAQRQQSIVEAVKARSNRAPSSVRVIVVWFSS